MKRINFLLIFALAISIFSCGSSTSTTQVNPHAQAHINAHENYIKNEEKRIASEKLTIDSGLNGNWIITEVDHISIDTKNFKNEIPVLNINTIDQSVIGHDGCNSFRGGFSSGIDSIQFGNLAATMKSCSENQDISLKINIILPNNTLMYKLESNLIFYNNGKKVMVLKRSE